MAKLDFSRRFQADSRFRDAVENFQREAIFHMLGVDPEDLAEAWDGRDFKLEVSAADYFDGGAPDVSPQEVPDDVESPVADLTGEDVSMNIHEAQEAGDVGFLVLVRDLDERSSVAGAAHKALFDLRTAQEEE